jgi:hypothetical protein
MRVVRALIAVAGGLALSAVPAHASPAVPAPVDGAVGTAHQTFHPEDDVYRCAFGCYDEHTWNATWVIGGSTWTGVLPLPRMGHDGRVTTLVQFDMSGVSSGGVTLTVHCSYNTIPSPYHCLFTLPGQTPRALYVAETLIWPPSAQHDSTRGEEQEMLLSAKPDMDVSGS